MATKPVQFFEEPTSEPPVKKFDDMTSAEYEEWNRDFIAALWAGDDSASKASLAAGVPIYYAEPDTPDTCVIKKYSDGRKELVTFVDGREEFVKVF